MEVAKTKQTHQWSELDDHALLRAVERLRPLKPKIKSRGGKYTDFWWAVAGQIVIERAIDELCSGTDNEQAEEPEQTEIDGEEVVDVFPDKA